MIDPHQEGRCRQLKIECITETHGKTGVEMEALTGVTASALCVYDMLKAVSKEIQISDIKLLSKSGGKTDFLNTHSDSNYK